MILDTASFRRLAIVPICLCLGAPVVDGVAYEINCSECPLGAIIGRERSLTSRTAQRDFCFVTMTISGTARSPFVPLFDSNVCLIDTIFL